MKRMLSFKDIKDRITTTRKLPDSKKNLMLDDIVHIPTVMIPRKRPSSVTTVNRPFSALLRRSSSAS